jgi:hypothetical protein
MVYRERFLLCSSFDGKRNRPVPLTTGLRVGLVI